MAILAGPSALGTVSSCGRRHEKGCLALVARIGVASTRREKRFLQAICRDLNVLDHPLQYRESGRFAQLVGGFRGGNDEAVAKAVQKRTLDPSDEHFQKIEKQFYDQFFL